MKFEYLRLYLSNIIKFYIRIALKHQDWKILSIDPVKDIVVLERFDMEKNEGEHD